jgi:Holliday junction resolvase
MGVNGKRKGNNAELQCAAILSKHLGGKFVRTPGSGAFIGGLNAARKELMSESQIRASKSDIFPPDEYKKLVVEVKSYAALPYHAFATSQDIPKLDGWIKELEADCDETDIGILCFKTNRKGWSVCVHVKYLSEFNLTNYVVYKGYVILGLEEFLKQNNNQFKKIIT